MGELELHFKKPYGRGADFVAAIPFEEDAFRMPDLTRLSLSVDHVDADGGRIRIFLQRMVSICQNFQSVRGYGSDETLIPQIFLEEAAKIPGRMEQSKELFLTLKSSVAAIFHENHANFVALRVLKFNVDYSNVQKSEEILQHLKRESLTKLVIFLKGMFREERSNLKLPVMENLEELGEICKNLVFLGNTFVNNGTLLNSK